MWSKWGVLEGERGEIPEFIFGSLLPTQSHMAPNLITSYRYLLVARLATRLRYLSVRFRVDHGIRASRHLDSMTLHECPKSLSSVEPARVKQTLGTCACCPGGRLVVAWKRMAWKHSTLGMLSDGSVSTRIRRRLISGESYRGTYMRDVARVLASPQDFGVICVTLQSS